MRVIAALILLTLLGCDSRKCLAERCHTILMPVPIGDTVVLMPLQDCRCIEFAGPTDGGTGG